LANTKSAKKAIRASARRRIQNQPIRTGAKSAVKKAVIAVAQNAAAESTSAAVVAAISALDVAASKGIIHRNNAARRKSRLMARLNSALKR
jgi:small subunit ribosomal protein S20